MRQAAKRDQNEPEIIAAYESAQYAVEQLSGTGQPDLLVLDIHPLRRTFGQLFLVEVKMPGKKLRPAQVRWHAAWPGSVAIVHDAKEALEAVK